MKKRILFPTVIGLGFFAAALVYEPNSNHYSECIVQDNQIVINTHDKHGLVKSTAFSKTHFTVWRKGQTQPTSWQNTKAVFDFYPVDAGQNVILKFSNKVENNYFYNVWLVPSTCYDALTSPR